MSLAGYLAHVPVRRITSPPGYHWFGYYDKLQFDPTQRFVLGMQVGFEHRSPEPEDLITVGMVDLQDGDRWIELGQTRAWCWQQGCMLQWRPGSASEVLWNDREADRFVCRILDVATGERNTVPWPIYTVSPDGRWGLSVSFSRIGEMYEGYGYAGPPDPDRDRLAPEGSGVWLVDLTTGEGALVLSIAEVAQLPYPHDHILRHKHYMNHLLFSPDGARFEVLHRWCGEGIPSFDTRMITARPDGSDLHIVDDSGKTSHFIWRDPQHILAWSWHQSHGDAFYLFEDGHVPNRAEVVGLEQMPVNGHVSYLPDRDWILNDTYPHGDPPTQTVYLYHVPTDRRFDLAHFANPPEYRGEWRCDLHPRCSRDGKLVTVDAPSEAGRQLYLLDVGELLTEVAR